MKVYIKYFDQEITRIEKISQGDWIDLRAAEDVEMKAGELRVIRLGVGMILPEGYEAHEAPAAAPKRISASTKPTASASLIIPTAARRMSGRCPPTPCGIR